jgi:hypothetical protein
MFRAVYSVSLCCPVYCLCVNVYCIVATGSQPNCSSIYLTVCEFTGSSVLALNILYVSVSQTHWYVPLTPCKVPLIFGLPSSKLCSVSFAKISENRRTQTYTSLWERVLHENVVRILIIFLSILLNSVDEISQECTQCS